MSGSEQEFDKAEQAVAELSATAVNNAYNEALKNGLSVYISDRTRGYIYEIFPSGEERQIKSIEPPLKLQVGTKIEITR